MTVAFSIVGINFVLRLIMMVLIKYIGYHTESEQTKNIKSSIFIVQFFNTAILLLLTNANTSDVGLGFLPFKGRYPDLTFGWYNDIAPSLITTMLFNAFFPIIEFFINFGMKIAFRFLDRSFTCDTYRTKKKTVPQYVTLYSGPEYLMHYKYSAMMNITFVTFMFGLAIPLLFPIALLSFMILFVVERLCITYFYKKPPMYDEKLNASALSTLKWAPVFLLFFGYWIMSNKQLFGNTVLPLQRTNEVIQTDHKIFSNIQVDQSFPLLLFSCLFFICVFFNDTFLALFRKCRVMDEEEEIEVDEDLDTYFGSLSQVDKKIWYFDEHHNRKDLDLKTLTDEAFDQLRHSHTGKKTITVCPNYEIVSNPKYADQFGYTPIEFRDTEEEKLTSDMVLKLLNLAYFTE